MLNRLVFAVFALCGASTLSATALSQASQKHATGMIQTAGLKTSSSAMPASMRGSHLLPNPVIPPIEAIAPPGAAPTSNTTSAVTGATFEYDRVGNRTRMTLSNGLVTDYVYDARYRLRELRTHRDGVTIQRHVYTVDASGLRTEVESTEADGTIRVLTFGYDPLKRLISEVHAENGAEVFNAAYIYDKVGDRTRSIVNGVTTDYFYNVNDWLISETTVGGSMPGVTTYTYDDNGNRLSKSGPLGTVEYRYNDANRMVELLDGSERIVFGYDVDGMLVEKTFFKAGLPPLTQRFVWDTNRDIAQVIEEWVSPGDDTPHVSATYVFADELIAQTRNGVTSFVLADGMGSTRALADTGGTVTDTFRYDAFGNVIGRTGSTPADHLYRGEQLDPNAGFYYLRARWMDPRIGQFTQMDSFAGFSADPPSLHKYLYAQANPVNAMDPSGYMTLMELGSNLNTLSNLYTVASTAFDLATGNYVGAAEGVLDIVYSKFSMGAGGVAKLNARAEALFARIWARGKTLKLGGVASSKTLAQNLDVVGFPRPIGAQAHHLVGGVTDFGRQSRAMLKNKFNIDVNSPLNGVWLPDCKGPVGVMTLHCGKHAEAYERLVFLQLNSANTREEAISVLAEIRRQLLTGELSLNSVGALP